MIPRQFDSKDGCEHSTKLEANLYGLYDIGSSLVCLFLRQKFNFNRKSIKGIKPTEFQRKFLSYCQYLSDHLMLDLFVTFR